MNWNEIETHKLETEDGMTITVVAESFADALLVKDAIDDDNMDALDQMEAHIVAAH